MLYTWAERDLLKWDWQWIFKHQWHPLNNYLYPCLFGDSIQSWNCRQEENLAENNTFFVFFLPLQCSLWKLLWFFFNVIFLSWFVRDAMLYTLHFIILHWSEFFHNWMAGKGGGKRLPFITILKIFLNYKRERKQDSVNRGWYHHHI